MKKRVLCAAASLALAYGAAATADDRLVRFDGGIGVIPARVGGVANTVRGVNPGGQVWVISRLNADVRTDGGITVDGRGLLLGGGDNIGTNGGQSVRARLFCGPQGAEVVHNSELVPLEANGDFRIDGMLDPVPLVGSCERPVLLIVSGGGNWFAAGIPKQ
jgi:hypothetical protein